MVGTGLFVVAARALGGEAATTVGREQPIGVSSFRVIEGQSGPTNYYSVVNDPEPFIRAEYKPPWETTVLGFQIPENQRHSIAEIRWKWRAMTLPRGGNECADGKQDSAATVYVIWKRGLKYYTLKYVWSADGTKGATCDRKRNPFVAQETVIVDSGPPLNQWRTVRISPDTEFRNHFEGGRSDASVPALRGIGIMSDGDATRSPSAADFAGFTLVLK